VRRIRSAGACAVLGAAITGVVGSCNAGDSGEAACFAAGGECVVGGCPSGASLSTSCTGGAVTAGAPVCCVPCPVGTMPDESAVTCVAADGSAGDAETGAPDASGD